MKLLVVSFLVFILFWGITSCDAPRLNPLDPNNQDFRFGVIDGYVKTEALPRQPIPGVKVSWKNHNIIVETDANGYFIIENIPLTNGELSIEKDGYSSIAVPINWGNKKSIRFEDGIFLNAIPKLDNLLIYTSVENRYPEDQRYTLYVKAQISDVENDVDTVSVRCSALNFNKQLKYSSQTNNYELNYFYGNKNSLPSLDDAIGKNFEIIVKDRFKKVFVIGSTTIKRIIKQEILFESPANGQTVGAKPVLRWKRYLPGFNFKYLIQIYTDETVPQFVWEKYNVSKDDIEIIPENSLSAGDYFWIIGCVDDFQNRAVSKNATFVVR